MKVASHSPRRQRRALYRAHPFERRIRMTVPLSRELRARFKTRSLPVRKGDTVRVLSGSFVGREERVAKVDRRDYRVTLDNVTLKTADEKLKPLSLGIGNLVITRLNLSDPWRRRSLRVRDEDVTPEERGETPEETTEAVPDTAGAPPPEPIPPAAPPEAAADVEGSPEPDDAGAPEAPAEAPTKTTPRSRAKRAEAEEPSEEDAA